MEKEEIKAIAIKWLDDGINSLAMRRWINCLISQMSWENDTRSQGKNPDRMAKMKTFTAKREGMAVIIDVYLADWLADHDYPIGYKIRQEIFTMAHQLLTGKEKVDD